METEESVTGVTEVLQKMEVNPESIGLVSMKAQAGIRTILDAFVFSPNLEQLDLDKTLLQPTFADSK